MYWMLGGTGAWTGGGKIELDALVDLNNKCTGSKSGGAAGAGQQTSGNYELSTQGFRTWVWQNDGVSEASLAQAKQRANLARQGATSNGMKDLGLDQELVVGSVSLRYRLDLKYNVGPADALDISFRSSGRSGQQKKLDASWTQAKSMSRSVPWPWIKGLGYVSDLVIGSAAGLDSCAPTETSGGSGSLVNATLTLKSLLKLKQAHTQLLN